MEINKEYKGLIDEGWRYKIEGDVETTEDLRIDLDKGLYVSGSIKAGRYIKAGRSIVTGEYIEAGGSIEAGEYIEAGRSVVAGEYIKAGRSIVAGGYIVAGEHIKAGRYIEAGKYIKAGEYIKAGRYIEAGRYIKAGGYIVAGEYIKAGGYIEAGRYIKAGGGGGIVTGLHITCKGELSFGLRLFAGTCSWREIEEEEKTITCGKLVNGTIEYGILKETGIEEVKEYSMDEVAEALGVDVKSLKIKK